MVVLRGVVGEVFRRALQPVDSNGNSLWHPETSPGTLHLFFFYLPILMAEASFLELIPLPHLEDSGDYNLGAHAATPVPAIVSECDSTCAQGETYEEKGSTLSR